MIVREIAEYIEFLFPSDTALEWDNVGLQVGNINAPVETIFVALTLTDSTLEQALSAKAQLIVTHHPMLFRSLNRIDCSTPLGRRIQTLIKSDMSVVSIHTNLDVASGGVSDVLARIYGIERGQVIQPTCVEKLVKLVVYVPDEAFIAFRENMLAEDVGHMGNYSHCSFSSLGEGTFKPLEGSTPYSGSTGELSRVSEKRFETICSERDSARIVERVKHFHPYEEVAYDLIPQIGRAYV